MRSRPHHDADLAGAEAVAASAACFLASAVAVSYFMDRIGLTIRPIPVLIASGVIGLAVLLWARSRPRPAGDLEVSLAFAGVIAFILAWLLWLSWPNLLPPGSGSDLTHHLQLVEYLDRHWRLPHDPAVEAFLGEMSHYTPGVHLLAVLAGRWFGADGLHATFPVVALAIALKAGIVFLVALRAVEEAFSPRGDAVRQAVGHTARRATVPIALIAVGLLFLPQAFFVGSFARHSYLAQVVTELFVAAMWLALLVWDRRPSIAAMVIFAATGIGAFLTWPVFVGPPLLLLVVLVATRSGRTAAEKFGSITVASVPIGVAALAHALGRAGWIGIVRTTADTPIPTAGDFGWLFLALSALGIVAASSTRSGRITVAFLMACLLQSAALYVLATANGAAVPYMAIKMAYLAIYPMAVAAAVGIALIWRGVVERVRWPAVVRWSGWASVAFVAAAIGWQQLSAPPPTPAVSEPFVQAGRWARDHVDPACTDYIVRDDDTAYWLHLAVLGNRRQSARTADDNSFVTVEAIIRWIHQEGLPYAVADLGVIPKDVLATTDELVRFGPAVVIKRRGRAVCPP